MVVVSCVYYLIKKQVGNTKTMTKFKVGDKIKARGNVFSSSEPKDAVLTVRYVRENGDAYVYEKDVDEFYGRGSMTTGPDGRRYSWVIHPGEADVVETNNTINKLMMTSLVKAYKALKRTEPEKTFIATGVIDENGNMTSDGQSLLLTYLLEKHGEDFKKDVLDGIVAEQEKNNSK